MEIAKALILAGHRREPGPWPTASAGCRHLFPVANRPILFHNLVALGAAGVLEAAILTHGDGGQAIQRAVGNGGEWDMSVRYAEWHSSVGLRGALVAAREFVGDEPVLVQQGDALLCDRMHGHISGFARARLDALALCLAVPDARTVGAATLGYLLSPRAVSILTAGPQVPDPLARVRADGGRVGIEHVDGCRLDRGDLKTLLEGNRRMLEALAASVDPASLEDCTVQGAVEVHPTAQVRRTLLRGPAIIGARACVSDAYVGPYTSIGAGAVIEGSEIEHSMVLANAQLRFVGTRLDSSVIGRGARVVREFQLPGAVRMSIGDEAEVVLR
jgi:glucose-1-phosphate thymidylyltransferase